MKRKCDGSLSIKVITSILHIHDAGHLGQRNRRELAKLVSRWFNTFFQLALHFFYELFYGHLAIVQSLTGVSLARCHFPSTEGQSSVLCT